MPTHCNCQKSHRMFRSRNSMVHDITELCLRTCLTFVLITSQLVDLSQGFNVDTEKIVIHRGDKNSMFGFAVAQHIDQDTSWILVGAPRSQTQQKSVNNSGAVFRCRTDRANDCHQIPFDDKGNNIKYQKSTGKFLDIEEKSDQWFGATVESSGKNGFILACAPRRIFFLNDFSKREPMGVCLLASSSRTEFVEYSPCKHFNWTGDFGYHKQGHCMAGFSAAITSDKKSMLVGAVGSFYWQGQAFAYNLDGRSKVPDYNTPEGPFTDDNSYLGFSTAIGEFDGDDLSDYVIGIPRGNNLQGKVTLLRRDLTTIANISGDQVGSFFGYSVTVVDLNGDKLDDIIVGAPFFFVKHTDTYDTGRVYVFYQDAVSGFESPKKETLPGFDSKSRFGLSVAALGNINNDRNNDLAVGAPYGGKDGRGAVYIYHGSDHGIITKPAQIIFASDLDKKLWTFGYSLSAGQDLDGNNYPDIVVGAYASERVVFLRSRPVVRVAIEMDIIPDTVNLEKRTCNYFGSKVTCFDVRACITYDGHMIPNELDLNVTLELDSTKKGVNKRALFAVNNYNYVNMLVTVKKKTKKGMRGKCSYHFAYIKEKIRDKLNAVQVKLEFMLQPSLKELRSRKVLPILDGYIPTVSTTQADIGNNCNTICIPDLSIEASGLAREHVIGSNDYVQIQVDVMNAGEDSFLSMLIVDLPEGVQYHNVTKSSFSEYVSCSKPSEAVQCDLGNPLSKNRKVRFVLTFTPDNSIVTADSLNFVLTVNSTNPELFNNTANNRVTVSFSLIARASLQINGASFPNEVNYNLTREKKDGTYDGISVIHLYEIQNNGPSTLSKTVIRILWPSYLDRGDALLTLDVPPIDVQGSGSCKIMQLHPNNASKYFDGDGRHIGSLLNTDMHPSSSRNKRDTYDDLNAKTIMCSSQWCSVIVCQLGMIEKNAKMLVQISSFLSTATLVKYSFSNKLAITSLMMAQTVEMPYTSGVNISSFPQQYYNISTPVNRVDVKLKQKGVAVWIIAVAVSCGILLLFLLIVLLWWCGFFKRMKMEDEAHLSNGKSW